MPIRLNVGCGPKKYDGYINVDVSDTYEPDRLDNATTLETFNGNEGTIDEIRSEHLFEHILPWDTTKVLERWKELLKKGGFVSIEVPDILAAAQRIVEEHERMEWNPKHRFDEKLTLYPLYSNPNQRNVPWDRHMWGYSVKTLTQLLEDHGFTDVVSAMPRSVAGATRDIRVVGFKS